jgi:hypothetical protein
MGAKSTIELTREEALNFIYSFISKVDDKTLALLVEDINDELWHEGNEDSLGLHNFSIVHCRHETDECV